MENEVSEVLLIRAEQNLQRQLDWVSRYDARIATVLGIGLAMVGYLVSQAPASEHLNFACILVGIIAIAPFAYLFWQIYIGQAPKTESPNSSLIFFSTIAGLKADEFFEKCSKQTDEQYFADLCHQTHVNAVRMDQKFKVLQRAFRSLFVAVPLWLISIAVFQLAHS